MADLSIVAGATSQSINIDLYVLSTGAPQTGLVFNSTGLTAAYSFTGTNTTATAITLATLAAVNSAYSSGGFKEIDATKQPGLYRFDIPNAALAAAKGRDVVISFTGFAGMRVDHTKIELTGWDNQLVPGTAGGMFISGVNNGGTTINGIGSSTVGLTITGGSSAAAVKLTGGASAGVPGHGLVITGGVASSSAAGSGILITGGASGAGGTLPAGVGVSIVGGAGSASSQGAAGGMTISGGGTNTVASTATGLKITGTSTGHGIDAESGAGATGDGIHATSNATNGNGMGLTGNGTGDGLLLTGGATGSGFLANGGATSGDAFALATAGSGTVVVPTTAPATPLTAAQIATGVWQDATPGDFTVASSAGQELFGISASVTDPWSVMLPGAYTAGEAGYILGNTINANIVEIAGSATAATDLRDDILTPTYTIYVGTTPIA